MSVVDIGELTYTNLSRTLVNQLHTIVGEPVNRYIEEGNIENETYLGASYSIICIKTL